MSRIGKQPVSIPAGVKVQVQGRKVTITGPLGTLSFEHHPSVKVAWNESEKSVACTVDPAQADDRVVRANWGTTRALIRGMVEGVTKGYEKSLEVVGVGWAPTIVGKQLKLVVGYANPIMMPIPDGLKVTLDEKNKQIVKVQGADKQKVGQFAAEMRSKRRPEPYNGKGIKYTTEVIKRKQGKQFGA
ncbi:50S ribosomal protein L6 [Leptolyngbya sp. 15MV]|nr:50S ribosomal protein L6 [Leptolyngbya sp. 15MV]